MQQQWYRIIVLFLLVSLALTGSPSLGAAHSGMSQAPATGSEAALRNALDLYNQRHAAAYAIVDTRQSGGLAYASAVLSNLAKNEGDFIVLLASSGDGQHWSVLIPGDSPSTEYNRLLDRFPNTVIDEATKAFLHQADSASETLAPGQTSSSVQLANFSSHKLPWKYGKRAYVTQKDTPYHMNQIDFDIEGLAESGDVVASKPGTVVFVKQSSSTTCTTPAPDPCWKKSNMVVIQHPSGEYSWYVHLVHNSVPVSVGQNVGYGAKIGVEGDTGYSTGVHLHYMASTGHTTWTDPNNPDDAPWATGITDVDFDEYAWADLVQTYSVTYLSQNAGNLPAVCPGAGGVLLYRNGQYDCASLPENSGYVFNSGSGFKNLPGAFDNAASSLRIPTGWSTLLYQNADKGGGKKCINAPGDASFSDDTFDNGNPLNDAVSSIEVFTTPNCPVRAPVDATPPDGDYTSPAGGTTVGRTVTLTANASDAQSGINSVRFTAKWGSEQRVIYASTAAPYQFTWDLCAAGIPDGDIALGMEALDNAGNRFTLSNKHPDIHITKAYDCSTTPTGTWAADYWANPNLTDPVTLHVDEPGVLIFHNWGSASPGAGIPAVGWSARYTQDISFPGGAYRFHCQTNAAAPAQGCRVFIDGQERIAAWNDPNSAWHDWNGTLTAGSHTIKVEYFNSLGDARLEVWWQGAGFLPSDAVCAANQWCADIFGNTTLAGTAAIHRGEGETLTHTWGSGGPDPLLPGGHFSGRFTRSADFDCGKHQFNLMTPNKASLWVDDMPVSASTPTVDLTRGTHALKLEYAADGGNAQISLTWQKISNCVVTTTVESVSTHYVRPGETIDPAVRMRVSVGYLDPLRGDRLSFVSGNTFGAATDQPLRNFVNTGEIAIFDPTAGLRMTPPAADGSVTSQWQVKVGGSPTGPSATIQVIVDSKPPQISISAPGSGYLKTNSITIQANPTDSGSGISHVQFFAGYDAGSGWAWHDLGYDADGSDGWGKIWDASGVPDQNNVAFFAEAWDRAGNSNGAWTAGQPLDRNPPSVALTPLAASYDTTRFLVQWSMSDAPSGPDHADLQVQMNGGQWVDWLTNQKGASGAAWFTGQLGQDYNFRVRGTDLAGNVGSYSPLAKSSHINTCTPDRFEPDNGFGSARPIALGSPSETHNICGTGDEDWFAFQAAADTNYLFSAAPSGATTATVVTVYAADGSTLLIGPANPNIPQATVIYRTAQDGTIYIKVQHVDSQVAGDGVTYGIQAAIAKSFYLPVINR